MFIIQICQQVNLDVLTRMEKQLRSTYFLLRAAANGPVHMASKSKAFNHLDEKKKKA